MEGFSQLDEAIAETKAGLQKFILPPPSIPTEAVPATYEQFEESSRGYYGQSPTEASAERQHYLSSMPNKEKVLKTIRNIGLLGIAMVTTFMLARSAAANGVITSGKAHIEPSQPTPMRIEPTLVPPSPTPELSPTPAYANLLDTPQQITSEFGKYPNGEPHYGLDVAAWYGDVQYAPVGGVITEIKRGCVEGNTSCGGGLGNHIWFKSDMDGKYVALAHYQKIFDDIQFGTSFSAGTPIGETGSTGWSTGPHAHIQVNAEGMRNVGSENPAWEFPWLRCGEPQLGAYFGAKCQ